MKLSRLLSDGNITEWRFGENEEGSGSEVESVTMYNT
jgi:hypothetical protein